MKVFEISSRVLFSARSQPNEINNTAHCSNVVPYDEAVPQSVLSGSVVVDDARANAKYTVSFPGVKQAPAQSIDGQVVELAKLFADIKINLEGLVPQNIASYEARFGHDGLENVTNLAGSEMEAVHIAGIRKALREILVKVMSTNVKVQINKSIQNMKNA